MSALKFVSEIASRHTLVLITGTNQSIAAEVSGLLKQKQSIQVVEISDANTQSFPDHDVNVVIHFAGFDSPSLAQTLYHTSTLHRVMDFSLKQHAKFILVLPEKKSPEQQTAISLVSQFGKNYSLHYSLITIPQNTDQRVAAIEIIRSFVHGFVAENIVPKTIAPEVKPPDIVFANKRHTVRKNNFANIVLVGLLTVCLVFLLEVGIWSTSLYCAYQGVLGWQHRLAQNCSVVAKHSSQLLITQMKTINQQRLFTTGARAADALQMLSELQFLASSNNWVKVGELLPQAAESLAYLQADLPQTPTSLFKLADLQSIRENLGRMQMAWPVINRVVKSPQQTWMVLLQDADELKATGGFLEKFALVSLEKGSVADVQFYDTENTDSQLRGQVDPPGDLKMATRQSSWYLRDGNWDPDFSETAERTSWFVGKELGKQVDGVVAVNTLWLQKIAKILGETELKYNPELLEKLKTATSLQKSQVWLQMLSGLNDRQILLHDLSGSTELVAAGWGGETIKNNCGTTTKCLSDSIYIVDSNVGINKINPFVKLSYKLDVKITPSKVQYTYTLTYTNQSNSGPGPAGDYVNYLRPFLSPGVEIDSMQIENTVPGQQSFKGVLFTVPMGQSRKITILAHRDLSITPDKYVLSWLNQPGQQEVPVDITVSSWIASQAQLRYNALLTKPYSVVTSLSSNGK